MVVECVCCCLVSRLWTVVVHGSGRVGLGRIWVGSGWVASDLGGVGSDLGGVGSALGGVGSALGESGLGDPIRPVRFVLISGSDSTRRVRCQTPPDPTHPARF